MRRSLAPVLEVGVFFRLFCWRPPMVGSLPLSKRIERTSAVAKYSTDPPVMNPMALEVPPIYFPCRWRPFLSWMESAFATLAQIARQNANLRRNRRTVIIFAYSTGDEAGCGQAQIIAAPIAAIPYSILCIFSGDAGACEAPFPRRCARYGAKFKRLVFHDRRTSCFFARYRW